MVACPSPCCSWSCLPPLQSFLLPGQPSSLPHPQSQQPGGVDPQLHLGRAGVPDHPTHPPLQRKGELTTAALGTTCRNSGINCRTTEPTICSADPNPRKGAVPRYDPRSEFQHGSDHPRMGIYCHNRSRAIQMPAMPTYRSSRYGRSNCLEGVKGSLAGPLAGPRESMTSAWRGTPDLTGRTIPPRETLCLRPSARREKTKKEEESSGSLRL